MFLSSKKKKGKRKIKFDYGQSDTAFCLYKELQSERWKSSFLTVLLIHNISIITCSFVFLFFFPFNAYCQHRDARRCIEAGVNCPCVVQPCFQLSYNLCISTDFLFVYALMKWWSWFQFLGVDSHLTDTVFDGIKYWRLAFMCLTVTNVLFKILLQVQLIPYNPDKLDKFILWTLSKDLEEGIEQ